MIMHPSRPFPPRRRAGAALILALLVAVLTVLLPGCGGAGGSSGSGGEGGPGGGGTGSDPDPGRGFRQVHVGEINVLNETAGTGDAMAEVVLPLHQGDFKQAPNIRTERGAACQVAALGATWPDGSLRYLRLDVPVTAAANGSQTVELLSTTQPNPQFVVHTSVPTPLPGIVPTFRVGLTNNAFGPLTLIEDGPLVRVYRARAGATSSMLYAELQVHLYSGQPHARFILTWGNSHPGNSALHEDPGKVWFEVSGARLLVDEHKSKVLQRTEANGVTAVLLKVFCPYPA